jgi:multiple sugar transport system permease protein
VASAPGIAAAERAGSAAWRGRPLRERRVPEWAWGVLLLVPAFALVAALILYPVVYSFWLSLHNKHAYLPVQTFVGLDHFVFFLTRDFDGFWRSLWLGTIYAVGSVALQTVLGVAAALVLNETFFGRTFVRGLLLFPYMVPIIVVVILMRWVLNDSYGIVPWLLRTVGLGAPGFFTGEMMMFTLILISTWTFFPFVLIGVLARLQTIDPDLYAAAAIDGAGPIRRFLHVTLPQIAGVLFVLVLLRVMFMFTKFDIIWLLTGGGGVGWFVRTLPVYTFMKTFQELQVGAGACLSVIMFLILSGFAVLYFKLFKARAEEGQ